jgi:Flp pilus assembly protein TadB
MTEDEQRQIDGLGAAIARLDRERHERDEYVNRRFEELEQHAEWLQIRLGQIFLWLAVVAVGYAVKEWLGQSIITAIIAFVVGAILAVLFIGDGKKGPIPWRHIRHLPHLRRPATVIHPVDRRAAGR